MSDEKSYGGLQEELKAAVFKVGDEVVAAFKGQGGVYPGTVVKVNGNGTHCIHYDDGDIWAHCPANRMKHRLMPKVFTSDSKVLKQQGLDPQTIKTLNWWVLTKYFTPLPLPLTGEITEEAVNRLIQKDKKKKHSGKLNEEVILRLQKRLDSFAAQERGEYSCPEEFGNKLPSSERGAIGPMTKFYLRAFIDEEVTSMSRDAARNEIFKVGQDSKPGGWIKSIERKLEKAKEGLRIELTRHNEAKRIFEQSISESKSTIATFRRSIESGDLKAFSPRCVHGLLEEIGMASLYSFFLDTKIVDGESVHLEDVNEKFFEDIEERHKVDLGTRKCIVFHLKKIKNEKYIFHRSLCDNFMSWDEKRVQEWLGEVSCLEFRRHFETLKVCGITLACVGKAELVKEVRKAEAKISGSSYAKRNSLEKKIDTVLWTQIEKLRRVLKTDDEKKIDRKIPEEYLCELTEELMINPVMTPNGKNCEREAIAKWVKEKGTCPFTRKPLKLKHLYPNLTLKAMIKKFKRKSV